MLSPPPYAIKPSDVQQVGAVAVACFPSGADHRDERTIRSFGEEWEKFDSFEAGEIDRAAREYFDIVPPSLLGPEVVALDLGCGSGRWTRYIAPHVGHVDAVDPSHAVLHAARKHADLPNVRWSMAGVEALPFPDGAFHLIVCLGVLHHVPDTAGAIRKAVGKLAPGGHLLLYLYYALDGRGFFFKALFRISDLFRRGIHRLPGPLKRLVCDVIAFAVYLPLRTLAQLARAAAGSATWWRKLPLSYYHDKSITVLRNDALDRFGTPLEQRFTREEIHRMMADAGLVDIRSSDAPPYWHALGRKPEHPFTHPA